MAGTPPLGAENLEPQDLKIVNGETTADFESTVAILDATTGRSFCTGVLVGCSTVLTAAHCLCSGTGEECGSDGPGLLQSPSELEVYAQHGGVFGVESFAIHPDFDFGEEADVAILRLDRSVDGVQPSEFNETVDPMPQTPGLVTGFGLTDGEAEIDDSGLKRTGSVVLEECTAVPGDTHLCWRFEEPVGPAGGDSNTCAGDSGGPLFLDVGGELVVAGVTSGGTSASCQAPDEAFDTDLRVVADWIRQEGGTDLDRTVCGPLPAAGSAGTLVLSGEGDLGPELTRGEWSLDLPAGIQRLRVAVNGVDPEGNDYDLSVRFEAEPDGINDACASERDGMYEVCDIVGPDQGEWNFAVDRIAGEGAYQIVVTSFAVTDTGSGCQPTADNLCLGPDDRFKVTATWRDFEDVTGVGKAVDIGRRDSGLFYFFGPDNLEVLIKVLDGCGVNDRFWVFSAATTNVEYTLTVEDTLSGEFWEFQNPQGQRAPAVTDTDAFDICP